MSPVTVDQLCTSTWRNFSSFPKTKKLVFFREWDTLWVTGGIFHMNLLQILSEQYYTIKVFRLDLAI